MRKFRSHVNAIARGIVAAALLLALTTACADAQRTLKFMVYGDTRDGHDIHRRLVALMMKEKPDFIIQTGDLVRRGNQNDLWKIYDDITGDMRKAIPVYPSRGNHDVGGTGYEERVTAPFTSGNKLYYSFNKGNSHFIALAIDENTDYKPTSPQYKWLEKDLADAHKKARHIFVFFHVPPYSIGSHGSDLDVREAMCPLFEKYGVQVVLNGHDHLYYRTRRNGISYIVSGGGGAALYYPDPAKGAIEGDKWERVHHYVRCEIKGDTVTMAAIREDGTEIEHLTLVP